ncbi:sporulation membrane protein YtrH [Neobacillus kokaensis]|uniref:Sporulation membrane protein YtrH n=2 Tax=Neobacillus kokaensis TaxID=2759023 RepID=A0ABQ3MZL7_9BACI|nr:sporulation membrane protein YtrH [Neobacillus kokaensis]
MFSFKNSYLSATVHINDRNNIYLNVRTEESMKEIGFFPAFIESYFIALGVLLGGSLIGGIASFLTGHPPLTTVYRLSSALRIWAIVAAIGGTFDAVYTFERGFLNADTKDLFKQFLLILSALGGAQTGALIINWMTQEHISS